METTINGSMTDNHNNKAACLILGASIRTATSLIAPSSEGLRSYERRKRRKMTDNSIHDITFTNFYDKIRGADDSASNQKTQRLGFGSNPGGPGECSLRDCSKTVLQQTPHSHNGHEDAVGVCIQNAVVPYQENGCMYLTKESLNNGVRGDNQPHSSSEEVCNKQSEGCTNSELCGRAFSDILNSDKFLELCSLLLQNFGVNNVNQVLDVDAINSKMKNGAYETSPMLFVKDIQQVWTKLQQVSNEMATIAKSLSDKSLAHYEQFVKKPKAADGCQGCGKKADVRNCLVCDSCDDIYHLSCTDFIGTEIPPKSWYCASCVSNGIGSPHDNCVVCEKLKAVASISQDNGDPKNDQSRDVPNGLEADILEENHGPRICFICKSEVNSGDNSRTCGHSLCSHKFYHIKCLTNKQLGVCGPCWFCPSCLCRRCLVDKDDDQIVLCDGCDQAYHIYCTSPQLNSIPEGRWFCEKCDREVKRISIMKRVYENMQKKVKVEEDVSGGVTEEGEGLDMLVSAAKTLSHQDTINTCGNTV